MRRSSLDPVPTPAACGISKSKKKFQWSVIAKLNSEYILAGLAADQ